MLLDAPLYAYIPARDLARARNFHEGKLGFKPKKASQAFWQLDDIAREVKELKARGIQFEKYAMPEIDADGIMTAGGARAAWFKDSEGNIMALIQSL